MGEEPGTARAEVTTDSQDPERTREEIEATRREPFAAAGAFLGGFLLGRLTKR